VSGERNSLLVLSFARRGEEEMVRRAVGHLTSEFPGAHIAAVGTPVSAPALRELGLSEVIVYGGERGARGVMREVRGRAPSAAGIVYGGPGFSGHLKLELVALASDARRVYQFAPGRSERVVGRLRLGLSVWGKALCAAVRLAVGGVVCGIAFCWLSLRRMMAGGGRASRA